MSDQGIPQWRIDNLLTALMAEHDLAVDLGDDRDTIPYGAWSDHANAWVLADVAVGEYRKLLKRRGG